MSDYANAAAALIKATRGREDALGLRDETSRSRFLLHKHPTAKVIVFFHGFTASPEQFVPIGEAFFQAGYNVLIPLLPGHGQAGDWSDDNPPPLPITPLLYQDFGQNWLEKAQSLGDRVLLGGLSGGSTLAAWLALEHPQQVDRGLLFAPYLSGTNAFVDWVVERMNVYFEWKSEPGVVSFGYKGFQMPALRTFLAMGQEVLDRAKVQPTAPLLLVSSASDHAVDSAEHQALFQSALKLQPQCWYHCFDRTLAIGHNMMTRAEGNERADLPIAIAKAYAESDLTWKEVTTLSDRLQQGETLEAIAAQLNLSQRLPSDRSALLTALQLIAQTPEELKPHRDEG
ncbi:alpha/beta fold hydrolase [Leptolyngbya sp. FACHB-321]|uniref:alpha/beta hydrolase n=1 Tax=Leptolyngbya sp. FACHB-321 TaxID=2692807 RepID=UPI0016831C89|nr:alpha/beta fold hydrolase [Leptolyngbya sp. FACHB-321]MBD2035215.1 alpha/beta fold hydrolase [Leptolyngbya sp. FACHB-321]